MDKIWLSHYPAGIPADINPDAFPSLVALYQHSVAAFADKTAFQHMGINLTYAELAELSQAFAAYLQQELGMRKGQRLAIMLPNCLQYPVALFGALQAGLIVVNVNPLYTARELQLQLADCGAQTIIILANFTQTLETIIQQTAVEHVIVSELGDLLHLKGYMVNFVVKHVKHLVPEHHLENAIPFKQVLEVARDLPFNHLEIKGEDLAFLQYTGGTTGISKGAMLSHRNMVANVEQASAWLKPVLKVGEEVVITALPLYHIFALTANCLTFMSFGGCNVLITNPRDFPAFIQTLSEVPFTAITGVNTLFNALTQQTAFADLDFSQLRITLGGGMAVQSTVAARWEQITGIPLLEAYGLTEAAPAVCINPLDAPHYTGSAGLPVPSTEIGILSPYGEELKVGEVGELCVKGPQVMRGYWRNESETRKVFDANGWLHTGDMAFLDPQGYVHIVDRQKDMILVSGFNVYPNEIEAVVMDEGRILEVAAVGVPDERSGETVKLVVVRRDPITREELLDYCRANLTAYKLPKYIEFRSELPKNNVGKILRRVLRET
ncbi:MAG: AMP-binding protein [Thiotrichaceae bacterium]|nr:AMP-binding protein [Thiotrichaceae bacterium]